MADGRVRATALALGGWACLGSLVGLVNWLGSFFHTSFARSYLLSLLVFWGLVGLVVGAGLLAVSAILARTLSKRGKRLPWQGFPGRFGPVLKRIWAVAVGIGVALLAAYIGSAPRFSGFLSSDPRDLSGESSGPPNIILISLDTTRPDHMGAYGYGKPISPNFDRLAGEGTLFTRAVATSSWTVPSHASILTGAAPSHLGPSMGLHQEKTWIKVPDSALMAAEIFQAAGYHTAGFVAGQTLREFYGFGQGFEVYRDDRPASLSAKSNRIYLARLVRRLLNIPPERYLRFLDPPFRALNNYLYDEAYRGGTELHVWHHHGDERFSPDADEINHRVFKWLDRRPPRPYFLFVNYFDPHDPYEPLDPPPGLISPEVDRADGFIVQNKILEDALKDGEMVSPERLEGLIEMYDAEISVMDRHLGQLMARLEAELDLENALIVVVSDHGEAFGEHGLLHHGHHLFDAETRQILLISGRGVARGRTVPDAVSGIDILPTILDLAEFEIRADFEGRSLVALMEGESVPPHPVFSEVFGGRRSFPEWKAFQDSWVSVELDGLKLIRSLEGGGRLYDVRSDPGELMDLSSTRPEDLERLGHLIDAYLLLSAKPEGADPEAPTEELLETLKGLGYIE